PPKDEKDLRSRPPFHRINERRSTSTRHTTNATPPPFASTRPRLFRIPLRRTFTLYPRTRCTRDGDARLRFARPTRPRIFPRRNRHHIPTPPRSRSTFTP